MVEAQKGKVLTEGEFDCITYIIEGDPVPLSRPRIGKNCLYDSQKQAKLILGIELSRQHGLRELYVGPIGLDFMFYFHMPPSSKKHHDKMRGTPHFFKPDISNLIKMYEDISNKILFNDDCLIAEITARKVYDDRPRTEFTIRKL